MPKAVLVVDPSPPAGVAALSCAGRASPSTPRPPSGIGARVDRRRGQAADHRRGPAGAPSAGRRRHHRRFRSRPARRSPTSRTGSAPTAIVRSMPNTPAQVGRGITAAVANARVGAIGGRWSTSLLEAVGEVVWVDDEALIDAVTAVSGSGPAYVFLLAECLEAAAIGARACRRTSPRSSRGRPSPAPANSSTAPSFRRRNSARTSPRRTGRRRRRSTILMAEDGLSDRWSTGGRGGAEAFRGAVGLIAASALAASRACRLD